MTIKTIEKLCCPFDISDLNLTIISQDKTENIIEGLLICDTCKRIYPIISGIPIMSPDEYREFKFEQPILERWKKYLEDKKVENFRLIS
ncbi:hypothetical protein K0U91_09450 [Chryseobacterium chendengshani]|uniref:Trm112 family protein n=1 Tax=Chryseobacterium sp. LJ668 TaxID=2864040 RepID=UPI001C68D9C6|nr:Trm112 family protein [Chryseobacterium sp. LJ668]MBW8524457.1 hypothetical protein [Chryseobacterium sp. LJ668]QYK15301.1 hypothetical protein K0U91_09450 [Chryseobacterium sp. LJ668]